jgi:6-phosphogluconolactonase (cycloisomerase 2 family)
MAEYRLGNWANALEWLRGPEASSSPEVASLASCFGAMARFQLGDQAGASNALSQAGRRLKEMAETGQLADPRLNCWDDFARALAVRAEAETLILGREVSAPLSTAALAELANRFHRAAPAPAVSKPGKDVGRLTFVNRVVSENLRDVLDVTVSRDDRFLYAACYLVPSIVVFSRDTNSGAIVPVQTLYNTNADGALGLVLSIRLSPDQHYAVAASGRGNLVVFKRDRETGRLEHWQTLRSRNGIEGIGYPVRAGFSLDGQQVYALDGARGGVTAFAFNPAKGLQWLQTLRSPQTAGGSRDLAQLPDGRGLVVVNYKSHALTSLARDPGTGRLALKHAILDGESGADWVEGQYGVTSSPDGKFIYVASGRSSGDNAVSVFQVSETGELTPVQSFLDGDEGLSFVGGYQVSVSPDGKNLYATASRSGTLACFARDADNGRLRLIQSFVNDKNTIVRDGPAGLECSRDGRFVYVATQYENALAIFQRDAGGK